MIREALEAIDDMIAQSKIDDKGRQLEASALGTPLEGEHPLFLPCPHGRLRAHPTALCLCHMP